MEFPLSLQQIQRLDSSDMLSLLTSFADQLGDAVEIVGKVHLTAHQGGIHNVLVTGMGGSAIGGDLLRDYLADVVDLPIVVNRGYHLPCFVGPSTLVFASSYSGDTEETLAACREALQRKSNIVAISSGGELAQLASQEGFPLIQIPRGYPPRAALGYSFVALLMSMSKMGLVGDQEENLGETQELIRRRAVEYGLTVPLAKNEAKEIALKLHGKLPFIYAWAQRLEAVAIRWRGQLAENAKQLSSHHLLPEMNHNEIVGWGAPRALGDQNLVVVFLRDRQEPSSIAKRTEITKELIGPSVAEIVEVWTTGASLLARLFSLLYLGDFVSLYLAALNGVDPTPVLRIEKLKRKLMSGS
jgi:glucose/mannose-6-phosphate isomerase